MGPQGYPGHGWLHRCGTLQSDLSWGLVHLDGRGSHNVREKEWHPAGRLAQVTKSPQNSKMQRSMDTATDISPANSG